MKTKTILCAFILMFAFYTKANPSNWHIYNGEMGKTLESTIDRTAISADRKTCKVLSPGKIRIVFSESGPLVEICNINDGYGNVNLCMRRPIICIMACKISNMFSCETSAYIPTYVMGDPQKIIVCTTEFGKFINEMLRYDFVRIGFQDARTGGYFVYSVFTGNTFRQLYNKM